MARSCCPSVPSTAAANKALQGKRGAVGGLITSTLLRSLLILPIPLAINVATANPGEKGSAVVKSVLGSLGSSLSITTFLLVYMARQGRRRG